MPWYKGKNISVEEYRRKTAKAKPKSTGTKAFTKRTHKKPGRVGETVQKTTGLDKLQGALTKQPKPKKKPKPKAKQPAQPKKKRWYQYNLYDLFK
jgi:hypothetical protein